MTAIEGLTRSWIIPSFDFKKGVEDVRVELVALEASFLPLTREEIATLF